MPYALRSYKPFAAAGGGFCTARLPFSNFHAYRDGRRLSAAADVAELDRHDITGLAIGFFPQRNDPSKTTGEFYLSLAHIKAYRKRDEPEFVYLSDADVSRHHAYQMSTNVLGVAPGPAPADAASAEGAAADPVDESGDEAPADEGAAQAALPRLQQKLMGEQKLQQSGLTYFIVRPSQLEDRPGGTRRLAFSQGDPGDSPGSVSRADVAEVVVSSLLDPRACNVACTVTESSATPVAGEQDISKLLEAMQPNRD